MGKRYYKGRYRRHRGNPNPIGLLVLLSIICLVAFWQIALLIVGVVAVCFLLLYLVKYKKAKTAQLAEVKTESLDVPLNKEPEEHDSVYSAKKSIMTACEKLFFDTIKEIVEPSYMVQPQINLASIIDKESKNRYRNELFRNIDFGILDDKYSVVVLIEINDQTHTQKNRIDRDKRVRAICEEAGIPLITFWTKYGVNKQYIQKQLALFLPRIKVDIQG